MSEPRLRWGVLGTGGIAAKFAAAVQTSATGNLVAVGSRAGETAEAFAATWGVGRAYGGYDAVLSDPEVDAVYIATPHTGHRRWAIAAARAGKHLLVEKPIAVDAAGAQEVIDEVRANDVFLLEGYQYRSHPQTELLVELVTSGAIGDVRMTQGSFGFHAPLDPSSRLFDPALGGGGILDVGCYPVSMAVLLARSVGADTAPPAVVGGGHIGTTGVDEWAAATITFDGRFVAQVDTAVSLDLGWVVKVFGSSGTITVPSPWLPSRNPGLVISRPGRPDERGSVEAAAELFSLEVDTVHRDLASKESPTMPWADTMATMKILDAWRAEVGVAHPSDAER